MFYDLLLEAYKAGYEDRMKEKDYDFHSHEWKYPDCEDCKHFTKGETGWDDICDENWECAMTSAYEIKFKRKEN